jgi:hypothetical protein
VSKPDGKNARLLDELGKAIGLLGNKPEHGGDDGKLMVTWFLDPLGESRKLAQDTRRVHLLQAVTAVVGDEDRRGRAAADDQSPWWYHLASRKPAAGGEPTHVPVDVVVADRGVPAIGVGARHAQAQVAADDASKRKLGVLLWIRAWLLGVQPGAVPLVQPLDAAMRPQLEGELRLGFPTGFLSSAAIRGALRLPAAGAGVGVDATLSLAGWKPRVGSAAREPAAATDFTLRLGEGATGSPRDYLAVAARLVLFVGRSFLEYEARDGNLAQRLVDHLLPLFGSASGPIKPFPLFANAFGVDEPSRRGLLDGNTYALADWARQFNPVKKPPFDWNLDAPANALAHLWGLVRRNDKVADHRDQAVGPGSLVAWLVGDDVAGGFGLHLDGELEAGNRGWMSAGVVGRKRLLQQGNLRVRLDLALALARIDFAGWTAGQPWPPPPPTVRGPAFEISLALEPVNDGQPLVAVAVPGTSATIRRGKLTVRWQPGQPPELRWRFETSVAITATPEQLAAHALAELAAALPADVKAFLDAARTAAADVGVLLDRLRAITPTLSGSVDGVAFALTASAPGAPASLSLTAGGAIAASLGLAGGAVSGSVTARLPIPVPDDRVGLALELSTAGGALALGLRLAAGGQVVTVPLALPALADAARTADYLLTLLKQLAVPAATAALLDGEVLKQELAAGVTLGDALGWAGVLSKRPGTTIGWALRDAQELVKREALQVIADVAAALAQLRQAGVDVGGVNLQPAITTTGSQTAYGVAVGPVAATPPVTALTLFDTGDVRAGVEQVAVTGLVLDGGKARVRPALTVKGLALEAGSKDAPLLATELASIESARVSADLTLGDDRGLAITRVGVDVGKLRLALGGDGGGLASSLFGKSAKDNPGFSLGFDRTATGVAIRLHGPRPLWVNLDAQLGPLTLQRFGLDVRKATPRAGGAEVDHLYLLLDGGFALGPIAASASGLGVYFQPRHLASPGEWRFTLDGLGLSLDAGPVSLSGFLQRHVDGAGEEFRGAALIKLADFQIGAVGAYRQLAGKPSLFVFGALNAPLGGPPFFFVTGVAGGFGVNRALVIPDDPEQLAEHVFFKVMEGDQSSLANVGKMGELLASALPAEQGSSWFAAGVKFTSFSLIRGKALLYVRLGGRFELGIAARAGLEVPSIASVTLVLKGAFIGGADPCLTVRADLVKSWLLSQDCRLTGSFFFGVWPRRGDCLVTLGGFHKAFVPPSHYPTGLSRLGFSWSISSAIKAEGQVYFALTPREAMAGASLSVAGSWGPLAAGFDAWFDGWIGWDPFWFDLEIGVRVWVRVFGIKASLGVSLHIWGPPVGGTATIEIAIWSFTIPFGKPRAISSNPLRLGLFVSKHLELELPAGDQQAAGNLRVRSRSVGGGTAGAALPPGSRGLLTIELGRGARAAPSKAANETQATVADGSPERPFRVGPEFVLDVRSRIPVTTARYGSAPAMSSPATFGFAPCQKASIASELRVVHVGVVRHPPAVTLLPPSPMPSALFGERVAKEGDSGEPTRRLPMGVRLDGGAALGAGTGVVRLVPELARADEIIRLPSAWEAAMLLDVPEASPTQPGLIAPASGTVGGSGATIGARIVDAPIAIRPLDTSVTAPIAARELVIDGPRLRPVALTDVVLHDLRPELAPAAPTAVRIDTVGGEALAADGRALAADGLRLTTGETLVLHDLADGVALVGRSEQALQVVWVGGFGAALDNVVVAGGELGLPAPAGAQRALVRGLGREPRASAAGFEPRTPLVRVGSRAWWAPDCMLGLLDGEPVDGEPAVAPARAVTRRARSLRLAFAPARAIDGAGKPLEARRQPGGLVAVMIAASDPAALERGELGRWTRTDGPLDEPRVARAGDGVVLTWRHDGDDPFTLVGELDDVLRVIAATRIAIGDRGAYERLADDGRMPRIETLAGDPGDAWLTLRPRDREVDHG